jgi:hypothetical protein
VGLKDLTGISSKGLKMFDNYVTYLISDMGAVYHLKMKLQGLEVIFIDSYKIMPLPLAKLTKDFKIKNIKLDYDIVSDCYLTEKNQPYIENDVIGLFQCIKKFFEISNATKHTIASCSYEVFSNGFTDWDNLHIRVTL